MRSLFTVGRPRIIKPDSLQVGLGQQLRARLALLAGVILASGFLFSSQPAAGQPAAGQPATDLKISVGIGGTWKVGHVTPVRVDLNHSLAMAAAAVEVSTYDGDGVAVTYHCQLPTTKDQQPTSDNRQPTTDNGQPIWCDVTIGRPERPLTVRVIDAAGQLLSMEQIEGRALGTPLPPTQTWIIALGSSLGVEATSHTLASTGMRNFSTTVVTDPHDLPQTWRGLAGCDVLILSTTGDQPLVSELNDPQWQSIEDWIGHGGSAVISLGSYATQLAADSNSPLSRLLPGDAVGKLSGISTSPLEASTTTSVQLGPIVAAKLKNVRGVTELSMLDNAGKRFPWWVRYSIGKGVVNFVGSDLDEPVLRDWKDRRLVWDKLLSGLWSRTQKESVSAEQNVSGTQYLGYDDLIGQLRATLDYFPTVRISTFGEIALILAVILVVIGPLDYWLSVRWLRRPELSWIMLSAVLIISSSALIWLEHASRPAEILVNSAQVIDYLPAQKRALVDSWSHVYSSRARTLDLALGSLQSAIAPRLDWQGLPGRGLGGMESNLLSDQGMPGYSIDVLSNPSPPQLLAADRPQDVSLSSVKVAGVGIPTSGTKCFFATWSFAFEPLGASKLQELRGIDQIEGLLVNPLDQDILDPVLMYHNWVYQLPSRLRAGEELNLTYEMIPKDLMRRLNHRQIVNNSDVITPWVPDDRQSLDRLLEIMMFYKAAGGFDYARLQNRFQPRIDISSSLGLNHAVLFGKLAEPVGGVQILSVAPEAIRTERRSTLCRVMVPVARAKEIVAQ